MIDDNLGLQFFAISEDGKREEITDLYWFEEEGIHNFGEGTNLFEQKYTFEIYIDGIKIYPMTFRPTDILKGLREYLKFQKGGMVKPNNLENITIKPKT